MSDVMNSILERRSVRKFEEKPIPDEILNTLLQSVRWSPSWANTQCWEVIVIKDESVRIKLQEVMSPKNPATRAIVQAPVLLALCAKLKHSGYYKEEASTRFGDWFLFDLGIASQSISLAAHSMGLGSVTVGAFDQNKANTILNLPEGYDTAVLIPVGYPAKISSAPKRRDIAEFTHNDTF